MRRVANVDQFQAAVVLVFIRVVNVNAIQSAVGGLRDFRLLRFRKFQTRGGNSRVKILLPDHIGDTFGVQLTLEPVNAVNLFQGQGVAGRLAHRLQAHDDIPVGNLPLEGKVGLGPDNFQVANAASDELVAVGLVGGDAVPDVGCQ